METPSLGTVRFGPFEVRPATRELFKHGMRVKLPPQAFEVLRVLLERRGELVTRQEFHRILWSADTFVDFDQGLNNAVKRIREVLNDSAETPRYIETLPRLGYRFIAEMESASPGLADPAMQTGQVVTQPCVPAAETAEPVLLNATPSIAPKIPIRRKSLPRWLLAMAAAPGLLGIAWLLRPSDPKPRITGTLQLTADGIPKWGALQTDGLRVYFTETVNGHQTIAAVPVTGGQAVPLKLPFSQVGLDDISADKTDLLVVEAPNMYQEAPLWRIPIVGGTPRRLGNVASHDAKWSPDGKTLAYVNRGDLYLANADGSNPHLLLPATGVPDEWAWHPIFSPDGRRIRFDRYNMQTNDGHIWEVNADGSNPHRVFESVADRPMEGFGTWTPDGRSYLFEAYRDLEYSVPIPAGNLWAMREKAGIFGRGSLQPDQLTTGPVHYFMHAASLDGKTIFALSFQKHGELMRYHASTKTFSPYMSGISATALSFSPDAQWVAYVKYPQGELWRSRIDGSEPLQLSSHPLFAGTSAWSPDGRQIAFNGTLAGRFSQSYMVSLDGGEPRLIEKIGDGCDPRFMREGTSLVFMDDDHDKGGLEILNLKTGVVAPIPGSKTLLAPRISPDGRWIAAVSHNVQKLLLYNVEKQSWRELAHVNSGLLFWIDWSNDSSHIYFERSDPEREIVRIPLKGGTPEVMVKLNDYRTTGPSPNWFALTPQDEILVLHDSSGTGEIYALSWDAP
ncbi:hypothetical protein DYQ86_23510 [Acidobacteria bacterium AB60]|nr:hypothetical protein DYQ86_23510 [Acidobacteria bacterium AB60]